MNVLRNQLSFSCSDHCGKEESRKELEELKLVSLVTLLIDLPCSIVVQAFLDRYLAEDAKDRLNVCLVKDELREPKLLVLLKNQVMYSRWDLNLHGCSLRKLALLELGSNVLLVGVDVRIIHKLSKPFSIDDLVPFVNQDVGIFYLSFKLLHCMYHLLRVILTCGE